MSEKPRKKVRVHSVAVGVAGAGDAAGRRRRPGHRARTSAQPPTACVACCDAPRTRRTASTRHQARCRDGGAGPSSRPAYQNLHAARAQMIDVYDDAEIEAEIPAAMARSQQTLHRDDPRRAADRRAARAGRRPAARLPAPGHRGRVRLPRPSARAAAQLPQHHPAARAVHRRPRRRSPSSSSAHNPTFMPLCFAADGSGADGILLNCPTGDGRHAAPAAATSSWSPCSGCSAARSPRRCRSATCAAPPRRTTCRSRWRC